MYEYGSNVWLKEGAGNAVLSQLVQTLIATLHARYSDRRQLFTDDTAASLERHDQVVQAIADLDPLAAEAAAGSLVRARPASMCSPDWRKLTCPIRRSTSAAGSPL